MNTGKNEFPLKLRINDVVAITDMTANVSQVELVQEAVEAGASIEAIRTIEVLLALKQFMRERHCDSGFEVELA